jgi:hypothetical protein
MNAKRKRRAKEAYIASIRSKAKNPKCNKQNRNQIYATIRRLNK